MNKYASKNQGQGHNGTINGTFGKKNARREREEARAEAREEAALTPKQRLAALDKLNLTAARERKKLTARL